MEMAEGVALCRRADASLSITGIAGPGGGTEEEPVGLVYIGCYERPCKGRGILFYRQQGQEPGICGGKGIDAAPEELLKRR